MLFVVLMWCVVVKCRGERREGKRREERGEMNGKETHIQNLQKGFSCQSKKIGRSVIMLVS